MFGLIMLVLSLHRARRVPPNRTFAECHIPEQNSTRMMQPATLLAVLSVAGAYVEIGCLFHKLLYLSFLCVAAVLALESKGLVPADSSRQLASVVYFIQCYEMAEHSTMKPSMTDAEFHRIIAIYNGLASFSFAFSVYNPTCVTAYLGAYTSIFLMGLWKSRQGSLSVVLIFNTTWWCPWQALKHWEFC